MQAPPLVFAFTALFIVSCASQSPWAGRGGRSSGGDGGGGGSQTISLSRADAQKIGRKIWQNESNGTIEGLTAWNSGEDFPSLGIGHFIWYPKGVNGPYQESFPQLISFMKQRNVSMPSWLANASDSPWNTRSEFLAQQSSPQMTELRSFLANTIETQTDFIVARLQGALPKMKGAASNANDRAKLERNFYAVAESPQGVYALIDYVNFKGEGTNPNERYKGQGWGLAQVLMEMNGSPRGAAAANEFSEAAKRVLSRRVQNAKPKDESMWLRGWHNRCETYKTPL